MPWLRSLSVSLVLHVVALTALATFVSRAWDRLPTAHGGADVAAIEATWQEPQPETGDEGQPIESPVVVMPEQVNLAGRQFRQESTRVELPMPTQSTSAEPPRVEVTLPESSRASAVETVTVAEPLPLQRTTRPIELPREQSNASLPQVAGFDTLPHVVRNAPPNYPIEAARNGWQGRVIVRLVVAADGQVTDAQVVVSSGHAVFDAAAIYALRQWQFQPASRHGVAVESTVRVPVDFRL